jgi:hypothetical protein
MERALFKSARVASACPVSWGSMYGDERVRFCSRCRLHVYNLSEMTWAEVQERLTRIEGRTCVTFYQRRDGTMLTRDCPLTRRERLRRWVGRSVIALACTVGLGIFVATLFGDNLRQLFGQSTTGVLYDRLDAPPSQPLDARRQRLRFSRSLDSY